MGLFFGKHPAGEKVFMVKEHQVLGVIKGLVN